MNSVSDIDTLVKSVLHKNSLDECDTELLSNLVTQYPYAAVFHVLLLAKLKDRKIAGPAQQRLSELYFSNPLWLRQVGRTENEVKIIEKISGAGSHELHADVESPTPTVTGERTTYEPSVETEAEAAEVPTLPMEQGIEDQPANQQDASPAESHESDGAILPDSDEPPMRIAPLDIRPVDTSTALTFEPFHTVDYFASQGIKISDDDKPKDKFGLQLKSFTEWLKTLKKTPDPAQVNIPQVAEQKVEQLARHSLDQPEVVTEAMAEVWEKQGNNREAVAVYEKLKLLNPSKSAYFAAKIEQLK